MPLHELYFRPFRVLLKKALAASHPELPLKAIAAAVPFPTATELHPALPHPRNSAVVGAHRGAMTELKENTLGAFELAIQQGAEVIEFDVRRTKDGVPVIHHDRELNGRRLSDTTFRELRAGKHSSHIPRLDELLELVEGKVMLDVELKEGGYEGVVLAMVLEKFAPADFVVTSFDDDVVLKVKQLAPEVCAGLLVGHGKYRDFLQTRVDDFFPLVRLMRCQADFLACSYTLADVGVAHQAATFGFPVIVWSVNDTRRLKRYIRDKKVSVVLSDVPDAAHAQREAIG
jgi:glycerophosphoryl diester phosphodiesterase